MAKGKQKDYPAPFGRYYLTQKIAMGGMAEIFRAKSIGAEGFEKTVVIKRILPHFSEDESFVTMFQDEARVAAHLNHPNVVQIFDFDEVDGLYYIAMEYVEGQDLKRALDIGAKLGNPMNIAQSVYCMIEAGQGLDYAHKREVDGKPLNIIHRDISPHNIMVSYNGEVKIMDFGIAKAASRSTKTRVGTVKGKCAYMSPEQARGKPLDGRSDLFALGVCLWEMLSGKRLFVGESDFETLNNVLRADVPSLTEMNPEVPVELDAIVQKALARDVDERHADVMEFFTELRRWFYQAVPDPGAVNIRDYMHDLFEEQINKLKADVAAEAEALNSMRTDSGLRRPGTGSNPAATGADADATVALDTSGLVGGHDADATVALDGAALLAGGHPGAVTPAPAKSKAGLFAGLGVLVAGIIAVGVFLGLRASDQPTAGQPAVVAGAAAAGEDPAEKAPAAKMIKITIKAPDAKEIKVNGVVESTEEEFQYETEQGKKLKIFAVGSFDRKKLMRIVAEEDGQVVELKLPETTAMKRQDAARGPIVIVKVEPANSVVTVDGAPVTLVNGNVQIPGKKLGDVVKIVATAPQHVKLDQDYTIRNQLETFQVKLEKVRVAAAVPTTGRVSIQAVPWAVVYKGSKKLGMAPQKMKLPVGTHTFKLKMGGKTKTITVKVKPGKSTHKTVQMN